MAIKVIVALFINVSSLFLVALFAGCGGGAAKPAGPTFAAVAPILSEHCIACHQDNGIAEFPLTSYADAKAKAARIKPAVQARRMPPSNADNSGSCGTFENARWLTDAQIATLSDWVDAGAPRGTGPEQLTVVEPEHLAGADVGATLDIGGTYVPYASAADDYRCFVVDPGLKDDRILVAYEVVPGEPRIVHHALLYVLPANQVAAQAAALDDAEPGLGYRCFGGAGVDGAVPVAGWAPGTPVTRYPEGTGVRIPGGRLAVLQIHYNLAAGALPDHTRVRLKLAESVPHEAYVNIMTNADLSLPPGKCWSPPRLTAKLGDGPGVDLLGVYPHMHLRGRTLRVERVRDGQTTCLLDVPSWEFHWQQAFFYDSPVELRAGDHVRVTCGFDTRADTETVTWGEGTAGPDVRRRPLFHPTPAGGDDQVTVTCPDGTMITATPAQTANFNVCAGLACPPRH